jgi:alpha-ribazole phosphatase
MITNDSYKNIYLVRHPKTEAPDGVCYGNSEILPDEEALNNAVEKVKRKMKNIIVDACYSSSLFRCRLFAEKLVQPKKVKVE